MYVEELLRTFPSLDTPYSQFSTSNYAASSWEFPVIREIIRQHREQLAAVETAALRVEMILRQLREKREQVFSSIRTHEGFVSVIRRLPREILGEIFIHCLPDEKYPHPARTTKYAPLLLTWVCREWREIALNTPILWCALSITEIGRDVEETISSYHHYWLRHTIRGAWTLSLELHLSPHFGERPWREAVSHFLGLYASQCTDLSVRVDSDYGLRRLLEEVPHLEWLSLSGNALLQVDMGEIVSIDQPSPCLRTLIIDSPALHMGFFEWFDLGWANLTNLGVMFPSDDDYIDETVGMFPEFLKLCPNLEWFMYSPLAIRKSRGAVSLTHPNLRELDVCHPFKDGPLRDTLTLPNLHHLRVYPSVEDANADSDYEDTSFPGTGELLPEGSGRRVFNMTIGDGISYFHTLFKTFNPGWAALTHLRIQGGSATSDIAFMIPLQHCSSLKYFVVSSITIAKQPEYAPLTHSVLRSLTVLVNAGKVKKLLNLVTLPGLCSLSLTLPKSSSWPHASFKEFVSRSNCALETLDVKGPRVEPSMREELVALIPVLTCFDTDPVEEE